MVNFRRVFGHFEAPLFLELCRHIEVVNLPAGSILFQPGDKDDTMYVVKTGRISVYIRVRSIMLFVFRRFRLNFIFIFRPFQEQDQEFPVKICEEGDGVFSLLSILDVLTVYFLSDFTIYGHTLQLLLLIFRVTQRRLKRSRQKRTSTVLF